MIDCAEGKSERGMADEIVCCRCLRRIRRIPDDIQLRRVITCLQRQSSNNRRSRIVEIMPRTVFCSCRPHSYKQVTRVSIPHVSSERIATRDDILT